MSLEEDLRLLDPPLPAGLVPPPDLADSVLRGVRRRRLAVPVATAAVAVAAAVAVVVPGSGGGGSVPATQPTSTVSPAPTPATPTRLPLGRGPVTVAAFTLEATGRTSLLDPRTGRYVTLPYTAAVLSPDGSRVAVSSGGRIGVLTRDEALRRAPVRPTGLVGDTPSWSPDGTALLVTELEKPGTGVAYRLQRYDLAGGRTSTTRYAGPPLIGTPMWAADSRDYLILRRPPGDDTDGADADGLQVLHPDGSLGEVVAEGGGGSVTYSPSRRLMALDPSGIMARTPRPATVVAVATGEPAAQLQDGPGSSRPAVVGWYDEHTVVRLDRGTALLLTDARTGRTVRTVRLPGVPALSGVQLGPATGKAGGF